MQIAGHSVRGLKYPDDTLMALYTRVDDISITLQWGLFSVSVKVRQIYSVFVYHNTSQHWCNIKAWITHRDVSDFDICTCR